MFNILPFHQARSTSRWVLFLYSDSEKSSLSVNRSFNRSASFSVSKQTKTYLSFYSLCSLWVGLSNCTQNLTLVLVFKEEQAAGQKKKWNIEKFWRVWEVSTLEEPIHYSSLCWLTGPFYININYRLINCAKRSAPLRFSYILTALSNVLVLYIPNPSSDLQFEPRAAIFNISFSNWHTVSCFLALPKPAVSYWRLKLFTCVSGSLGSRLTAY